MDPDPPQDALHLHRVSRRFGPVRALDAITLRVPRGTIYGLLGPNGAGKTTTIRIALGLLQPDEGSLHTLGMDPRQHPLLVRQRTGVVLEHDGHYEPMSAYENLDFHARLHGMEARERARRIPQVLDECGLTDKARTPVGHLSKGMKRMLAVARAILHDAQLLILDEPTTGIDARIVDHLRQLLRRLVSEQGVTILIATHNLHEAERLCDRVGILHKGRLILEGPPHRLGLSNETNHVTLHGGGFTQKVIQAVQSAPGVTAIETRDAPDGPIIIHLEGGAPAAPAIKQAILQGARIEAVQRRRTSLEDAFLEATKRTQEVQA
jgi:ABC-2 type transport system ATP-binding protein